MKRPVVHVIGAGAGGLSAARALLDGGACDVVVHEAQSHPGGRRRTFSDAELGRDFDTGAFAILSCWTATLAVIDAVGARAEWRADLRPGVAFADFATGARWRVTPNAGRWPWWLLDPRRRGTNLRFADYWSGRRLLAAAPEATVASLAPGGPGMERLWRPLTLAALNCPPETASAQLLGGVLRQIVAAGGAGLKVLAPARGIGRALVEPLARSLERDGAALRFGRRLIGLGREGDRVASLDFEHDRLDLGPRDAAILATPWAATAALLGTPPPQAASAALTIHFAAPPPPAAPPVVGALNGPFDWLFAHPGGMSVAVKDAGARLDTPRDELAAACWRGVAALTGLSDAPPAWRMAPSRRAAALATPAETARRPLTGTEFGNLFLAGGHVGRDFPDGLENAVRSGAAAARAFHGF
ncbi:protoporphyrinogen oxidase [Roseiarcus fermentans]|uniref:Protoporphyrinogen oxidase n=1 Tax=Roseiarcus fermentans TaxID=1473586 RepID=A0A366FGX2_9HYPH|nr:FAD-dependent oxidoreductase [Roseiarcus fermentans]RBP13857.1 protoporphyrinogen oxidase [Roseiarcus fermentans]